jgi:hypothetical protein
VRDVESLQGAARTSCADGIFPRDITTPRFQPGAFSVTDPDGNAIFFGLAISHKPSKAKRILDPVQH